MDRNRILLTLIALLLSPAAFAAGPDNTDAVAIEGKPSPSRAESAFRGTWVGKWPWGVDGVDVTITVGKPNRDGLYGTSYTWGSGQLKSGYAIMPGTLKAWGREQGDKLVIEWKNKQGLKTSVTLTKKSDDSAKAVYDTEGLAPVNDLSARETYLKRK